MVCERWCVDGSCVLCVTTEAGGGGRRREAGGTRDTESKTRTPHKVVGKKVTSRMCAYQNERCMDIRPLLLTLG